MNDKWWIELFEISYIQSTKIIIHMKRNVIKEKSFQFALDSVKLYRYLIKEHKEFVLSKQLLRSGTAVGALVREAEHAESRKDFIHKMAIAQKEANESVYWIELLSESGYIPELYFNALYSKIDEVLRILSSIIITSKNAIQKK